MLVLTTVLVIIIFFLSFEKCRVRKKMTTQIFVFLLSNRTNQMKSIDRQIIRFEYDQKKGEGRVCVCVI